MNNKNSTYDIHSLIKALETIISKYRCSFTDEEMKQMENCLSLVKELEKSKQRGVSISKKDVIDIVNLILRAFSNESFVSFLKDLIS